MNALASYLRHLIVTGILLAIEKLKLPSEGAEDAANVIALAIIGTLSWAFVKYVAPILKIPKGSGVALFALAASLSLLSLPSCSYVDAVVDTRGAIPTAPDTDLDGLPDQLLVSSDKVKPVLSEKGKSAINEGVAKVIVRYAK